MMILPLTKQLMNDYDETHAPLSRWREVPHEEAFCRCDRTLKEKVVKWSYSVETFVETNPEDAQVISLLSDAT